MRDCGSIQTNRFVLTYREATQTRWVSTNGGTFVCIKNTAKQHKRVSEYEVTVTPELQAQAGRTKKQNREEKAASRGGVSTSECVYDDHDVYYYICERLKLVLRTGKSKKARAKGERKGYTFRKVVQSDLV